MGFKPMLAGVADPEKLRLPLYASPKYDGVRGTVLSEGLRSRKLLAFPNKWTMDAFMHPILFGMDGELILRGYETRPDCFRMTSSALARQVGAPDMMFHVFDFFPLEETAFTSRYEHLIGLVAELGAHSGPLAKRVRLVENRLCLTLDALLEYEEELVSQGWEGVMIRSPEGKYKYGRSTVNEGHLLKFKRFADSEAEILEVVEQMTNNNPAEIDELGHTKRSKAKGGMVPAHTTGSLRCRDIVSGVEFSCATGVMDMIDAQWFWSMREQVKGRIIKYRFQKVGVKDKPRFPRYQGFREPWDH